MEQKLNIFHIPSWFPSEADPVPGYFIKEQIGLLAKHFINTNHAISTWGQNNPNFLMPINQPFNSIFKLLKPIKSNISINVIEDNCIEYSNPRYTWTRKIAKGNIEQIIKANLQNLEKFRADFGAVDVLHAHISYPAGYIAYRISKHTGIPFIISEHMGPFPFNSLKKNDDQPIDEIQIALQNATRITTPSQFLAKQLSSYTKQTIQVIPNFIDFDTYQISRPINPNFQIGYLGRLEESKGLWDLMEALLHIKEVPWKCVIAGTGSLFSQLKIWIENQGLQDKINLLGFIPAHENKVNFLASCDLIVLPSYHENFGITLIEAMACGKPVLSTKCGGPEEIITSENGLLVEVGEPTKIANAITQIRNNYDKYHPNEIRQKAKAEYDISVVGNKVMKIYKDLIIKN